MGRTPCCDKNELKKGPWTPEEDKKLVDYVQKHGHGNWRNLPKNAGLRRCGKSCRLRWTNYLRPDIKGGRFSFEEEEIIIQLHSVLGNKWSAIATRLPRRTDNEIKNYWNTHIRKRLLRMGIDPVTHSPRLDLLGLSSILHSTLYNSSQWNLSSSLGVQPLVNPELVKLAASLMRKSPCFSSQNPTPTSQFSHSQLQIPHEQQVVVATGSELNDDRQSGWILPSYMNPDDNFELPGLDYCGLEQQQLAPTLSWVLSSPCSSSPAQMNSNSSEDERESYCSQNLNFEIPDIFDEAFM